MTIELTNTDVVFIYGHFQKELSKIDEIASTENCPFTISTIKDQKAPYLSVVEKLASQMPELKQMDKYL